MSEVHIVVWHNTELNESHVDSVWGNEQDAMEQAGDLLQEIIEMKSAKNPGIVYTTNFSSMGMWTLRLFAHHRPEVKDRGREVARIAIRTKEVL